MLEKLYKITRNLQDIGGNRGAGKGKKHLKVRKIAMIVNEVLIGTCDVKIDEPHKGREAYIQGRT